MDLDHILGPKPDMFGGMSLAADVIFGPKYCGATTGALTIVDCTTGAATGTVAGTGTGVGTGTGTGLLQHHHSNRISASNASIPNGMATPQAIATAELDPVLLTHCPIT